jgi:mxaL protein
MLGGMKVFHVRLCQKGLLLWLALLAPLMAIPNLRVELPRVIRNYMFVLDITQSMNVRDMTVAGLPASRLAFARHLLGSSIARFPCGTKIRVALLPTRRCGNT